MARPNKRKTKRKRKRFFKKFKTSRAIIRMPSIMPDTLLVNMKYNTSITMVNVAGFGSYVFRMNSISDPDFTGLGHQPLGHDQWANFYAEYEVKSSSVDCFAIPTVNNPVVFSIYPAITSSVTASTTLAIEQPYTKYQYIATINIGDQRHLRHFMTVRKIEGRNTDSVNYIATFGSNPTLSRFWILSLASMTGVDISTIRVNVTITYHCKLFRRITLSES